MGDGGSFNKVNFRCFNNEFTKKAQICIHSSKLLYKQEVDMNVRDETISTINVEITKYLSLIHI